MLTAWHDPKGINNKDYGGRVGEVALPIRSKSGLKGALEGVKFLYRMLDCPPRSHTWNLMFLYFSVKMH